MSPKVEEAFEGWISLPSWHTSHPQDEARFFKFVWMVCRVSRKRPSAAEVREGIMQRWTEKLEAEYLAERALYFSQLCETLYDFADARSARSYFLDDDKGNPLP